MNALNFIVQYQNITKDMRVQGRIGGRNHPTDSPYMECQGIPVFHTSVNSVDRGYASRQECRRHKWGQFYSPNLVIGMGYCGGISKIYVDTIDKDNYYMLVYTKLDEDIMGPSSYVGSVVAWTPRQKNDSWQNAGFRMFLAVARVMDMVPPQAIYTNLCHEGEMWWEEWHCSNRCFAVLACIRKTAYRDTKQFEYVKSVAPEYLHDMLDYSKVDHQAG